LLDEHVPELLAEALSQTEPAIQVLQVGEENAPPKGTPDRGLLLFAEANQFTLFTRDKRSMPTHVASHLAVGHHTYGFCCTDKVFRFGVMWTT
jgi:hypothetical protein